MTTDTELDGRGNHVAAIYLSPDMLHSLLNLPPGARVVAAEGRMFPTGIRLVIEDPQFPLVPYDIEPPIAWAMVEVATDDDTGRTFVRYDYQWPKVLEPFTAEDLSMQFDEDHWFPFVENDRCNITGFGHQDKAAFAAALCEYDRVASGEGFTETDEPVWDKGDVVHTWAVRIDEETCVVELNGVKVTETTPKAFPVTTVWGRR